MMGVYGYKIALQLDDLAHIAGVRTTTFNRGLKMPAPSNIQKRTETVWQIASNLDNLAEIDDFDPAILLTIVDALEMSVKTARSAIENAIEAGQQAATKRAGN